MTSSVILDLVRDGVTTIILVSAPPLIMSLAVGIIVSIFQTVTSIQEPTLAFVPKILAVMLSLILFGSFMMNTLTGFFTRMMDKIPLILGSR